MTRLLFLLLVLLVGLVSGCSDGGGARPWVGAPSEGRLPKPTSGLVTAMPGDTVYAIARRYRLSMRAIIEENGLEPPFVLQVGQQLRLPRSRSHVVQSGDTIYSIARHYDIEMRSLVSLNQIGPPYQISAGQVLKLPARRTGRHPVAAARTGPVVPGPATTPPLPLPRPARQATVIAATSASPEPVTPAARKGTQSRTIRMAAPPQRGGKRFLWPVRGRVISNFGPRKGGLHNDGINIAAPRGAPILAADNGIVAYAGSQLRGFGKLLLIKHAGGWITAYAHADRLLVKRGDVVKRGQTIAAIGETGDVQRPQLHFEVRRGARAVDPRKQLET